MIHLRFSELFLSPGDAIHIYDPYNNSILKSYHGTDKVQVLTSVTPKNDSAGVVFTSASSQDAARRRFVLVHRALPQGKDGQVAAW